MAGLSSMQVSKILELKHEEVIFLNELYKIRNDMGILFPMMTNKLEAIPPADAAPEVFIPDDLGNLTDQVENAIQKFCSLEMPQISNRNLL